MSDSSGFTLGHARGYYYEREYGSMRDEVIEQAAYETLAILHPSLSVDEDDFIIGFFEGVYHAREDRREGC